MLNENGQWLYCQKQTNKKKVSVTVRIKKFFKFWIFRSETIGLNFILSGKPYLSYCIFTLHSSCNVCLFINLSISFFLFIYFFTFNFSVN